MTPLAPLTAEHLAAVLQEPEVALLANTLDCLGPTRTAAILAETLALEANGGLWLQTKQRRRTPGGVFFFLVMQQCTFRERRRLFWRRTDGGQATSTVPQRTTWPQITAILPTLFPAEASTMKLTLIGRPGNVEIQGQTAVFRLKGKAPGPLAQGLPPLPTGPPMTWTVLVGLKQWNRVKNSLKQHPDDRLICEGYPVMHGVEPVMFVQSCLSMVQQRAKQEAQRMVSSAPPT
jgi:hypothetical protein